MQILIMFDIGSWQTIMKLILELANSGLEWSASSADSNADSAKVCTWSRPSKTIVPFSRNLKDQCSFILFKSG